jgi:[ribosomal protein S5]-alanine N-acetyltransferase
MQSQLSEIFTIDCGEIYLREYKLEDAEAIYHLAQQKEIHEFLPDWKTSREQRLEWVRDYEIPGNKEFIQAAKNGEIQGQTLRLGIILKETNEFIGWICTMIKHELPAPNREIAYAISGEYAGRGYTTIAAKALVNYLFTETNIDHLIAIALTHNKSSNRVIEKCGFQYEKDVEIDGARHYFYQINKSQWN